MNIPPLRIGNIEASFIQGAMGVGISRAGLVSAVTNAGGIGTIAAVGLGLLTGQVDKEIRMAKRIAPGNLEKIAEAYAHANSDAFTDEIRQTRKLTNGPFFVNIMRALKDYDGLVETAIRENVDGIVTGAGLSLDLPKYLRSDSETMLIPIVSSGRAAEFICYRWAKKFHYLPDAIVVEGPKAGGHLGYKRANPAKPEFTEHLDNPDFVENGLERIVLEVLDVAKQYGNIPVIAAGGIFYGKDMKKYIDLGAAGVQMATRFVTTDECDADIDFKKAYINSKKEDIVLIKSPVGMPGRAIRNKFLDNVEAGGKVPFGCAYQCLETCTPYELPKNESSKNNVPEKAPYCIALALVNAQKGNMKNGFAFAGANAYLCKEIKSVKNVVEDIDGEYET